MKRREAREVAFRLTYEMVMTGSFNQYTKKILLGSADADSINYVDSIIDGITEHKKNIEDIITKYAIGYELNRIYKTDLAVLYLAVYELIYTDTPKAVIANEAVEIIKLYSDTQSYSFVNGILASVIKGECSG
ncbi:MAG: transcription antitermination factor NusB [Clostridiales bacterium]|nr:transcription antitermination factor NusB [Clostridiales bacterium]